MNKNQKDILSLTKTIIKNSNISLKIYSKEEIKKIKISCGTGVFGWTTNEEIIKKYNLGCSVQLAGDDNDSFVVPEIKTMNCKSNSLSLLKEAFKKIKALKLRKNIARKRLNRIAEEIAYSVLKNINIKSVHIKERPCPPLKWANECKVLINWESNS
jgi:hypothetical protein